MSSRSDSVEPPYNIHTERRSSHIDRHGNHSLHSMTRPLLSQREKVSSRSIVSNESPVLSPTKGRKQPASSAKSISGYTMTSTMALAPSSSSRRKKHQSGGYTLAPSIFSTDEDTEVSELHPHENRTNHPALDISRMINEDTPMTMREALPVRPVFPSEEAASTGDALNEIKTPEIVMAPAQVQHKGQQLMSDEDLEAVGNFILQGSAVGFALWLFLIANVYALAPPSSYEWLDGMELKSTWTLIILLFATNTTRIIPLAFQKNGFQFLKSGIVGKSIPHYFYHWDFKTF
jgi:hypothetical protein